MLGAYKFSTANQWVNRAAEVLGDAATRRLYVNGGSNYAVYERAAQAVEEAT